MADLNTKYDVVMIGAGPSALSAAVYTTRENISTVMVEKGVIGGLAAITDKVDNYPGFEKGVAGLELAMKLQAQAERFGAEFSLAEVETIERDEEGLIIRTNDEDFRAKAVLIATGSDWKKIGVPGELELYGRGVHYCATCDGAFYKDKKIVVVGGGNSAAQEALFLTRFSTDITVLVRSEWRASDILVKKVEAHESIKVVKGVEISEIVGEVGSVDHVKVKNRETGDITDMNTDAVFIFIGLLPNTGFLKGTDVELDDQGLVKTDDHLMTAMDGVFCSGDVRSGATMQIASAVGEGATAALKIREYLED